MQIAASRAEGPALRSFGIALLIVWLFGTWLLVDHLVIYPSLPGTGPDRDVPVQLSANPTLDEVADALVKADVITDRDKWLRTMRLLQAEPFLRGGWVVLNRHKSGFDHWPRLLTNRGDATVTVTIPEGFTRFDIATRLERYDISSKQDFLAATTSAGLLNRLEIPASSAEGYLFPATYRFLQRRGGEPTVTRMVDGFRSRTKTLFDRLARERATSRLPLSVHEAVILASIVEREAQQPEERPIIAGVFINRLVDPTFLPHRLQADPTVAYGCLTAPSAAPTCAQFDGRHVTPAMVRDPQNPYSTYRLDGLPPGPISNPGSAAIEAVVAPMLHDFFYFVATGGGRHSFSHSLDEHNAHIHGPR